MLLSLVDVVRVGFFFFFFFFLGIFHADCRQEGTVGVVNGFYFWSFEMIQQVFSLSSEQFGCPLGFKMMCIFFTCMSVYYRIAWDFLHFVELGAGMNRSMASIPQFSVFCDRNFRYNTSELEHVVSLVV